MVVPAAHAEADVEEGPLPELRGEIVLFVWVRDQSVVGRHHGDVEMHEVAEEGRLVGTWISGGYYGELIRSSSQSTITNSYIFHSNEIQRSNGCRHPWVCFFLHKTLQSV